MSNSIQRILFIPFVTNVGYATIWLIDGTSLPMEAKWPVSVALVCSISYIVSLFVWRKQNE